VPYSTVIDPSAYSAVLRRSFRKTFPPAVRGEGVYLWDARDKRYLDFSGSAAVNFIGHGVVEVAAAMAAQAKQIEFVHSSQFTTPVAEEYALELLDFAGKNFEGGCVYLPAEARSQSRPPSSLRVNIKWRSVRPAGIR
jgi:adenosylmethionine-8-amino-7-oxononanoate aminotransferase